MISIVIPIHNEEAILASVVQGIHEGLDGFAEDYELLLYENGSTDQTLSLAQSLAQECANLVVLTSPQAGYGRAIKNGILHARGERIVLFNADLWDMSFLKASYRLLDDYDIVIASKRHHDSRDERPWIRRLITWGFNRVLRVLFGFRGTDTHGMKAFRRECIVPIIKSCVTDGEILDTEIVLRSEQAGLTLTELPVHVEETRPSRYSPFARIPRTLRDLWTLYRALHTSNS